jgi:hypothetical protein
MTEHAIKTCPVCKLGLTLHQFEHDPEIVPIGMMFIDDDITKAYYVFQHERAGCGTSLVVPVESFKSAIAEPIPAEIMALKDCCERHCTRLDDLNSCSAPCQFAAFRRHIIDLVARKGRARMPKELIATR